MKKQTFEEWQSDFRLIKLQILFAIDQVAKYRHLIATQTEPGNLPASLASWYIQCTRAVNELKKHIERGQRWQLLSKEQSTFYNSEFDTLHAKAV